MSTSASPRLELVQCQDVPQERYFNIRAISLNDELCHCVQCAVELAHVFVSSDEPLRQKEPMCKAHAHIAEAEWMLTI